MVYLVLYEVEIVEENKGLVMRDLYKIFCRIGIVRIKFFMRSFLDL